MIATAAINRVQLRVPVLLNTHKKNILVAKEQILFQANLRWIVVQQERTCWFLWQRRLHLGSPSHSTRHNKSLDIPAFQLRQFEVHLKPITTSTQEGKHPRNKPLHWWAIIYSEEAGHIQIDSHEKHTHGATQDTHPGVFLHMCSSTQTATDTSSS